MPRAVSFNVPSRRCLFERQTQDEDGLMSHLPQTERVKRVRVRVRVLSNDMPCNDLSSMPEQEQNLTNLLVHIIGETWTRHLRRRATDCVVIHYVVID